MRRPLLRCYAESIGAQGSRGTNEKRRRRETKRTGCHPGAKLRRVGGPSSANVRTLKARRMGPVRRDSAHSLGRLPASLLTGEFTGSLLRHAVTEGRPEGRPDGRFLDWISQQCKRAHKKRPQGVPEVSGCPIRWLCSPGKQAGGPSAPFLAPV